jgi:hypothetical protein
VTAEDSCLLPSAKEEGIANSRLEEFKEFRSSGVQEFRSSGVQEFRSSGVQEFRSSGWDRSEIARPNRFVDLSLRLNQAVPLASS